ncbi:MAG: C40 family peptidase [Burkholderiales bacterium]|nr:MAG: C40 family peptidase [Burkholderiales bacterium]
MYLARDAHAISRHVLRLFACCPSAALALVVLLSGCASSPPRPGGDEADRFGANSGAAGVGWPARPGAPSAVDPDLGAGHKSAAQEVVLRALALLGTPYRFGGSSPRTGFDCSGLVHYVFREAHGLALPRTSEALGQVGDFVTPKQLLPGDLVFFNTTRRPFSHVGIYMGRNRFIHAPRDGTVVRIENLGGRYWRKRFDGARRLSL